MALDVTHSLPFNTRLLKFIGMNADECIIKTCARFLVCEVLLTIARLCFTKTCFEVTAKACLTVTANAQHLASSDCAHCVEETFDSAVGLVQWTKSASSGKSFCTPAVHSY